MDRWQIFYSGGKSAEGQDVYKRQQKDSSLLIIGNQQLKELGGFIASAYCCGIAYLYVPLTGNAALHAASHFCGVDLMGIPDVLQSLSLIHI